MLDLDLLVVAAPEVGRTAWRAHQSGPRWTSRPRVIHAQKPALHTLRNSTPVGPVGKSNPTSDGTTSRDNAPAASSCLVSVSLERCVRERVEVRGRVGGHPFCRKVGLPRALAGELMRTRGADLRASDGITDVLRVVRHR